jgi:hypothetical protein
MSKGVLMSRITKKKHSKLMRKRKNRIAAEVTSRIVWKDEKDKTEKPMASKIIFLGIRKSLKDKNLQSISRPLV